MKNQKRNGIVVGLAMSLLSLVIYSCTRSGPCEGSLTLENPIPDTTVAVGDTLFIDLTDPPVFVSSEGSMTFYIRTKYGLGNVDSDRAENPNDGRLSIIEIIALREGEATIEVTASHGCLENSTTFNITITEQ